MQCSYCHRYLTKIQINNKNNLILCCQVNQIFCLNCIFSPSIIQTWIITKQTIKCQQCKNIVKYQNLLQKRINIDLGIYGYERLQYGYSYFKNKSKQIQRPREVIKMRNFNYGHIYQINTIYKGDKDRNINDNKMEKNYKDVDLGKGGLFDTTDSYSNKQSQQQISDKSQNDGKTITPFTNIFWSAQK